MEHSGSRLEGVSIATPKVFATLIPTCNYCTITYAAAGAAEAAAGADAPAATVCVVAADAASAAVGSHDR